MGVKKYLNEAVNKLASVMPYILLIEHERVKILCPLNDCSGL